MICLQLLFKLNMQNLILACLFQGGPEISDTRETWYVTISSNVLIIRV